MELMMHRTGDTRSGAAAQDVCLISMPFAALERPSLALGILKAGAEEAGLRVRCLYPVFDYAERIGLATYCRVVDTAPDTNLGDWLFAGSAFPDHRLRQSAYLNLVDPSSLAPWAHLRSTEFRHTLWELRLQADRLVHDTAVAAVATGARIIGCTSVFQQQGASLALLRAVKQLDPSVWTLLGGANCEASMGMAVQQSFAWVDCVVSGEADLLFPDLCRTLLRTPRTHGAQPTLPEGVLGPYGRHAAASTAVDPPRARVDVLDACPTPDFTEYFDTLARSPLRRWIYPALPVETSRGCWWGQTHHCTFCGLNGGNMAYRTKSSQRVLDELRALNERYGTQRIHVVDNILSRDHMKTVIPSLAQAGAPYSMFYETKANLTEEELEQLANAGVTRIQPGIESLTLGALRLMRKGTTPVTNLQLLRRARRQGVFVTWNFLWQLPGDEVDWYAEVAEWLPLVVHLQAPNSLVPVRFDRFSPYHQRPADYGLTLKPTRGLRCIYPVDDDTLANLAYYFDDHGRPVERLLKAADPRARAFESRIIDWMTIWGHVRCARPDVPPPPRLEMVIGSAGIDVVDTRPGARSAHLRLEGLDAEVLQHCDTAPSRSRLNSDLRARGGGPSPGAIGAALDRLRGLGLILELDDRLLALPTLPPLRAYVDVSEYPGGYVLRDFRTAGELRSAVAWQ